MSDPRREDSPSPVPSPVPPSVIAPSGPDPASHAATVDAFDVESEGSPSWIRESPYWLIATLAHVVALLIFGTIIVFETQEKEDRPPITVRKAAPPPEPPKPRLKSSVDPVDLEVVEENPSEADKVPRVRAQAPKVTKKPLEVYRMNVDGLG